MVSGGRLALQRFSTAGVPKKDRHEAWTNRDWPSLAPVYRTVPTEPFECVSDRLILGDIVINYVDISGQRWTREKAQLRSFDPDHLVVVVTQQGLAHGTVAGMPFKTTPGDIQLVDLGRTSSHVSTASRTITVAVPRKLASARGIDAAELHGAVLRSGLTGLFASHVLSVRDAVAAMAVEDGALLARGVLDLLGLALAGAGRANGEQAAGTNGAAAAARTLIERDLGAASLSIARLCQTLGISRSTLHRLFESDGGVQAYIRKRRLEAVRRALSEPSSFEPIHMLAERLGFSDAAHLSRLFRAEYGMTPSDCRGEARNQQVRRRPETDHDPKS